MNAELEIMPVDHSSARAEQVGIMPTDMAVPKQVDDLMDVLGRRLGDLAFVWAAPGQHRPDGSGHSCGR